jgi:hypothetical protein
VIWKIVKATKNRGGLAIRDTLMKKELEANVAWRMITEET